VNYVKSVGLFHFALSPGATMPASPVFFF